MLVRARKVMASAAIMALVATSATAQSTITFTQAAPTPATGNIFFAVAEQAGFLKEEGLKVDWRFAAGGPIATQMVGSNNADIAEVSFEPVAAGYLNGVRGKLVFSSWSRLIYAIGVPEESPVKTLNELQGKRLGAVTIASASIPIAKATFKAAGISIDNSNFVPIGIGASAFTALKTGQVAAYSANSNSFAALARSGMKFRYFEHPNLGKTGNGGFFASPSLIEKRPKDLVSFLRSIAKSYVFTSANPEAAVRMLWKMYPNLRGTGSDEEAMKAAMAELEVALGFYDLNPKSGQFGTFDNKAVGEYLQTLRREEVLNADVAASDIISDQFLSAVNAFDREAIKRLARDWSKS